MYFFIFDATAYYELVDLGWLVSLYYTKFKKCQSLCLQYKGVDETILLTTLKMIFQFQPKQFINGMNSLHCLKYTPFY